MVVVAVVVVFVLWPLAKRDMAEGLPPTIYAFVLGTFVAVAWWSGQVLVGIGASLFLVSDAVLAAGRFWREIPGHAVRRHGHVPPGAAVPRARHPASRPRRLLSAPLR